MSKGRQKLIDLENVIAIADIIGVSKGAVSRWRRGDLVPSPKNRIQLQKKCGIPIELWDEPWDEPPPILPISGSPEVGGADPAPDEQEQATSSGSETERSLREQLARLRAIRARDPDMTTASLLRLEASETKLIQLLAQATGESDVVSESRIMRSQAWRRIRDTITDALAPYPEASMAVADALAGLE